MGALLLVLLVVMNTVRTRGQIMTLVLALCAVGTFEVIYGFAEEFSGHRQIFWHAKQYHPTAVTGTFHNKNHFAGLLELAVPMVLGLFIALTPRVNRSPSIRSRLVSFVSASGTHRQVILGLCLALMVAGIFFSLSRAGILCAVCSWAGFVVLLSFLAGFRWSTLVLLFALLLTLTLAMGLGAEMIIDDLEGPAAGDSASWADRLDLWGSGLDMTAAHPLFGTGFGTFTAAFERFQSMRFGDRIADFLHNDWLQLFCEVGLVGGAVAVLCLFWMIAVLTRRTFRLRDPFYRWIALGAMMATAAILLHSFFDYNLYKITANGLVFAVVLGIWHAASTKIPIREGEKPPVRQWAWSSRALGWVMALPLLALLVPPGIGAARAGLADIEINRFLAWSEMEGETDDYHFLPAAAPEGDPEDHVARALALDPWNARNHYFAARCAMKKAELEVRRRARDTAREILGPDLEEADPTGYRNIVTALTESLRPQMVNELDGIYGKARERLVEAVRRSPGTARYQIRLAGVLAELAAANPAGPDAGEARTRTEVALWLSPAKPGILFDAGRVFAARGLALGAGEGDEDLDRSIACFREALAADSGYAEKIYPLARNVLGGKEALIRVTPPTVESYGQLIDTLWESGDWEDVLTCLDRARRLADGTGEGGIHAEGAETTTDFDDSTGPDDTGMLAAGERSEESGDPEGAEDSGARSATASTYLNPEDRPEALEAALRSISEKRCTVLGILGQWKEREIEVSRQGRLAREHLAGMIHEAESLRERGRYEDSLALYLETLEEDWSDEHALLEAATLARLPQTEDEAPPGCRPIDLLRRVLINSRGLKESTLERVNEVLDTLHLDHVEDQLLAELIRSAGKVETGRAAEGLAELERLAERTSEVGGAWRQRHLVWFYLARAFERLGKPEEACAAYLEVIGQVPTHLPSLRRVAVLNGDGPLAGVDGTALDAIRERIDALTPGVPCRVEFGGRVVLLGLTLDREDDADSGEPGWSLTYHWMFLDRLQENFHPQVHFCDADWRILFQDDHRPRIDGRLYPVDAPRCGEAFSEKRRLSQDPGMSRYIRIGFASSTPVRKGTPFLTCDGGSRYFLTTPDVLVRE